MMPDDSKRAHHTRLVLGMADRQGLDLQELTLRGKFSEDQMEAAVNRCLGCTQPEACAHTLNSVATAPGLPDYCRNGDVFAALKPQ